MKLEGQEQRHQEELRNKEEDKQEPAGLQTKYIDMFYFMIN